MTNGTQPINARPLSYFSSMGWSYLIIEEIYYNSKDSMEHSPPATAPTTIEPKISLNAISESLSPRTMRLEGLVKNQRVVILIDSRSTHNFLDPSILKKIHVGVL
jgi:hypothetical protein